MIDILHLVPSIEDESDYIANGLLYCGHCRTPKQMRVTLPPMGEMPEREDVANILCKCRRDELAREKEHERIERAKRRVEELRREGITSRAYRDFTFDNDDGRNQKISQTCRNYVDNWPITREIGMLFYGPVGTGKTFYAGCIANGLIDRGVRAHMTTMPRLLGQMQYYEDRQETLYQISKYPLLVLDDLGAERETSFGIEQVFTIIDTRLQSGKPLICTTNLSLDELENTPRTELNRIYNRVLGMCDIRIRVDGVSRRTENAKERRERARELLGL